MTPVLTVADALRMQRERPVFTAEEHAVHQELAMLGLVPVLQDITQEYAAAKRAAEQERKDAAA